MNSVSNNEDVTRLIGRRISQRSADGAILDSIAELLRLLQRAGCDYLFLGSCALQAHLPHPHRLPNDIDVLIGAGNEDSWMATCTDAGIEVIQKPARMLSTVQGTLVHVMSGGLGQVDLESEKVFDYLPLDPVSNSIGERDYWLVGTRSRIKIPIPKAETLLAMALLRPLNSNTFLDCQAILQTCEISAADFAAFCHRTPGVKQIVSARLKQLTDVLTSYNPQLAVRSDLLLRSLGEFYHTPTEGVSKV